MAKDGCSSCYEECMFCVVAITSRSLQFGHILWMSSVHVLYSGALRPIKGPPSTQNNPFFLSYKTSPSLSLLPSLSVSYINKIFVHRPISYYTLGKVFHLGNCFQCKTNRKYFEVILSWRRHGNSWELLVQNKDRAWNVLKKPNSMTRSLDCFCFAYFYLIVQLLFLFINYLRFH